MRASSPPETPHSVSALPESIDRPAVADPCHLPSKGQEPLQVVMEKGTAKLRADGYDGKARILTSCLQGLQGLQRYVEKANQGGIERVLV